MSQTLQSERQSTLAVRAPGSGASDIEAVEATVQRSLARRETQARVSSIVYPTALVIVILLLWEAMTRLFGIPRFLLPPPSLVLTSLAAHSALLLSNTWITALEIIFGFALSIVVGVPLALAIFL